MGLRVECGICAGIGCRLCNRFIQLKFNKEERFSPLVKWQVCAGRSNKQGYVRCWALEEENEVKRCLNRWETADREEDWCAQGIPLYSSTKTKVSRLPTTKAARTQLAQHFSPTRSPYPPNPVQRALIIALQQKFHTGAPKRFMLFWALGSGKTVMALYYALLFGFSRLLILCSKTLATQWKDVVMGAGLIPKGSRVTIMSYEKFDALVNELPEGFPLSDFDLVVVDECHYYKNLNKAKINSYQLLQKTAHLLMLTGTPLRNDLDELAMYQYFMGVREAGGVSTEELESELATLIKDPQIIRYHPKLGVFFERVSCFDPSSSGTGSWHYPTTIESVVRHHPRPVKNLEYIHQSGLNRNLVTVGGYKIPTWGRGDEMSRNTILNSASKIQTVLENIKPDEKKRFPHVVFSMYRQFFPELRRRINSQGLRVAVMTGQEHADERKMVHGEFLAGNVDVLLLCRVGGDGLDLPNARTLHVLEPQNNEAEERQVVGRVIRGSTKPYVEPVHILRYLSELPSVDDTRVEVAEDFKELRELMMKWPEVNDAVEEEADGSIVKWLGMVNRAEEITVEQIRKQRNQDKARRLDIASDFLMKCSIPIHVERSVAVNGTKNQINL